MVNYIQVANAKDAENLSDLPEDVLESVEDTATDESGDETQRNEERTAREGLEQNDFIDPRGEDEQKGDSDV